MDLPLRHRRRALGRAIAALALMTLLPLDLHVQTAAQGTVQPAPQVQRQEGGTQPAPGPTAVGARRNLFLAPEAVRKARGQMGQAQPGPAVGRFPNVPSVPLPPPPVLGPQGPQKPAGTVPGAVPSPSASAPGKPQQGSGPGTKTGPQKEKPVRPVLLGVITGGRPQAILEHEGNVVVAAEGEETPWGKVAAIRSGEAVLVTKHGKMTLHVATEGIR